MAKKKIKGKEWFSIIAPKMFDEREIGKTLTSEPKTLIGRKMTIGLLELLSDMSKYYMTIIFKIKEVKGDKAFTQFDGLECLKDYISRLVLKRVRLVYTVQDLATKDGINIRVKSIAIIPQRIKTSVKKKVKDKIKAMLKAEVEKSTIEQFLEKIISDRIKNKVIRDTRSIYPVRNFEIRKIEVS